MLYQQLYFENEGRNRKIPPGQQQQADMLTCVKETIQNFKRLSGQGQYLSDNLSENQRKKKKQNENENNQKLPKSQIQSPSKSRLSIQRKLSFVQKRQSTKNLDLDFSSNTRINSKSSMSQLYQMKEYQSFHDQPLISKNDISFKKFKEKYFQQDESKEEEIKPRIKQISLKELRNSSLPQLPLTINELKSSLVNQFKVLNKKKNEDDDSNSNKIIEIDEENVTTNKYGHSKKINPSQSEGFSGWVIQKQKQSKGDIKESKSNVSIIGEEQKDDSEELSPQLDYYRQQQLMHQKKQKLIQQKNSIVNQPQNIQLPKEDIFIFKKLNKIYLGKIYEERILNKKFQYNVQPLYTPEVLNAMKRNSQTNLVQQQGQGKKGKRSRLWKSVPFLPDALQSNKLLKDSKHDLLPQKGGQENNLRSSRQSVSKPYTEFTIQKQPTLELLDGDQLKVDGELTAKQTPKKLSIHSPSLKGITTYSELNSMIIDADYKQITPLPISPQKQLFFNFNSIQPIQEEVSLINQKSTSIMQSRIQSQNKNSQDTQSISSSSSCSTPTASKTQQVTPPQQIKLFVNTQESRAEVISSQPKILLPSVNKYHLSTENSSISTSQIYNQHTKRVDTQTSPINITISTNLSQSQGLFKQYSNDSQVYPTSHDFVQEKAILLDDNAQKSKNKNSISFLSNKSVNIKQRSKESKRKSQSNNNSDTLNRQSLNSSQFKQIINDISPISKPNPVESKLQKKRNSIQQLFKFTNPQGNTKCLQPNSPLLKKQLDEQITSLNETVQGLSKQMITQQYGIQKLSDKVCTNQKESTKLFNFLNKKYDLCIEKKEKSFKQYIREINLPLKEQLSIQQKEKLNQRMSVSQQFQLDKQLSKLSKQSRIHKLSILSNMSGHTDQHDIYSPRNSLPQTSINRLRQLPQNATDLLLSIKKSKQIISPLQSSILTEKLTQLESKTQKQYTKS